MAQAAVRVVLQEGAVFPDLTKRLADLTPAMKEIVKVMRKGSGSVMEQFTRQQTIHARGARFVWPPVKHGGRERPLGRPALWKTGRYIRAWTEGTAGAVTDTGKHHASIGVDRAVFPGVVVHQAAPGTFTRAGRNLAARVPARPFRVNPVMVERARRVIYGYLVTGRAEAVR